MAITVSRIDLMDGNSTLKGKEGWKITRVALVEGLEGTPLSDRGAAAIEAVISEVGDVLTAHPDRPFTFIDSFSVNLVANFCAKVNIMYAESRGGGGGNDVEDWQIEVGATLAQEQSNLDFEGNLMEQVAYTYPTPYYPNTDKEGWTDRQGGTVSKLVPGVSMTITHREYASPGDKAREWVGKVNAAGWSVDPNAPARAWLCASITGRSSDSGKTYDVTYQFQYKKGRDTPDAFMLGTCPGWDETYMYICPDTGKPPDFSDDAINDGAVVSEALKMVQLYAEANFNNLINKKA